MNDLQQPLCDLLFPYRHQLLSSLPPPLDFAICSLRRISSSLARSILDLGITLYRLTVKTIAWGSSQFLAFSFVRLRHCHGA